MTVILTSTLMHGWAKWQVCAGISSKSDCLIDLVYYANIYTVNIKFSRVIIFAEEALTRTDEIFA